MASSYSNLHPVDQILSSLVVEAVPSDSQLIADKLFENMKALKRENLDTYAQELGLDVSRFKADLDAGKFKTLDQASERVGRLLGESVIVQSVIYASMKGKDAGDGAVRK